MLAPNGNGHNQRESIGRQSTPNETASQCLLFHQRLMDVIDNHSPSWVVTFTWSVLFYTMILLAASGNLLIIWIIATKPLMRNIMNRYLLNLAISDFLSITFNAGFNFVYMLTEHWPFGRTYCTMNHFISNLTVSSSVCTIVVISLDRSVREGSNKLEIRLNAIIASLPRQ